MKKWPLIAAIFELCVGIGAIIAYIVLAVNGQPLGKWTVTLILAVAVIVLGVTGILDWIKEQKQNT